MRVKRTAHGRQVILEQIEFVLLDVVSAVIQQLSKLFVVEVDCRRDASCDLLSREGTVKKESVLNLFKCSHPEDDHAGDRHDADHAR